jgi:Uma2 family endonuclease
MAIQVEPKAGTGPRRHFVTLDEYDRMVEAGVFEPKAHIELIRGEIVDMSPPGPEQEDSVARLHLFLGEQLHRRAFMWPQGNSIGLPQSNSRPQPDIALLKWRDDLYSGRRPGAEDIVLLVEVADSSPKLDRGGKLQLYAEAGIPEYWVVNLVDGVVEVYADPDAGKYQAARKLCRGESLHLPGGLDGEISVNDILGKESRR